MLAAPFVLYLERLQSLSMVAGDIARRALVISSCKIPLFLNISGKPVEGNTALVSLSREDLRITRFSSEA